VAVFFRDAVPNARCDLSARRGRLPVVGGRVLVGGPVLDAGQRAVVEHLLGAGGPLLVLAGPGTGKTTTLVEAVVGRVRAGDPLDRLLVLTFSRRAAAELRSRITARLDVTTREPAAATLHGYAWALYRRDRAARGLPPPRLLTGPERELEVRRLLAGDADDDPTRWPVGLRPALRTSGFARELTDFLDRACERGLDPDRLATLAAAAGREEWVAAAGFWRRADEAAALDPSGPAVGYPELLRRAAELIATGELGAIERAARRAVFVDEYQDTDPAQQRLLFALAGDGRDLCVVGDPDQSIYAFRGAEPAGLVEFPERFRRRDGGPAAVLSLRASRRLGGELLVASRRVAARLPAGPGSGRHRQLVGAGDGVAGRVEVLLARSPTAEAELIADLLRRAHLLDGVPWSAMAVLVRSARRSLPRLRRALTGAGVPVTVAADEVPLAGEPVVRALLGVVRAALRPASLDETVAGELLAGPLVGADPLLLRRVRRAVPSLAGAVRDPGLPDQLPADLARPLLRLRRLTAAAADPDRRPDELLWAVWSATGLAEVWERQALSGADPDAARAADRALDAVVGLFDAAARFAERLPRAGALLFVDELAAQEVPAELPGARPGRGAGVVLCTAHRAKGLEWDVVVVAGVEEGTWPDLRAGGGSLLDAAALAEAVTARVPVGGPLRGAVGAAERTASRVAAELAEERRLFYVAVTRARQRLAVTAAAGEESEPPSRFLDELLPGSTAVPCRPGRPPFTLPGLVADLRAHAVDPRASAGLRRAAAGQLARLAAAGVRGAAPDEWYWVPGWSDDRPLADAGTLVRVSPSAVEGFDRCALRWFFERVAGAGREPGAAQTLGELLHAVAATVGAARVGGGAAPAEAALAARLDELWPQLELGPRWFAARQREQVGAALRRFLAWQQEPGRQLVAVEKDFEVRTGQAVISGRVDRLERDAAGRGVVVDLKTGQSRPASDELDGHPQLGIYQLAVQLGAFAPDGITEPGGAELVQIGRGGFPDRARVQAQVPLSDDPDPDWPQRLVGRVATAMAGGVFPATVCDACFSCPVQAACPAQPGGQLVGAES
jgi:superfamily I DNA/RNA helicase/RecB family exonuclease